MIIECVPNFSESRNKPVIETIIDNLSAFPDVKVIDRHSDDDHNRTVLTLIGDEVSIPKAAFSAACLAQEYINLFQHSGQHPRIGALDVLPFIPLGDTPMSVCVQIAREVGKKIGEELHIPVYLYEEAAMRPERTRLENVRRGEFEQLINKIETDPAKAPDFGPKTVGSAGAIAVGARMPLIAFNVYLSTSDQSIADTIAKTIRQSSGGLPNVKALGLLVNGLAQVSMNLTNYRITGLPQVMEAIRREAAHLGTAIHHTELVGLIPRDAVLDTAAFYLENDHLTHQRIIESHL
jgi:glutamate formiminotransferase / formiminotetrahydrofolate cyclodeaminase